MGLYGRITKTQCLSVTVGLVVSLFLASNTAYAEGNLTTPQVQKLINESHFDESFQISATPEVVTELNNIRHSKKATATVKASFERMKKYQDYIQQELRKNNMPEELIVIPLVESGYQPLPANINPVQAAGIWQLIPHTATEFGLVINGKRDDRMNTELSTQGALSYLTQLHTQFNNWGLAAASYEIGENNVDSLIQQTSSKNVWTLARSSKAPKDLGIFLATFDASLIIMKNPEILK